MKQSEIKELSTAELQEKLSDTKKTYVDLKMTHAISPLENPIQLRSVTFLAQGNKKFIVLIKHGC